MPEQNCPFCGDDHHRQGTKIAYRDGEFPLYFESGRCYIVHGGTPHFVLDHNYSPPANLIGDVMESRLVDETAIISRANATLPVRIGFLAEDFDCGAVPGAFPYRLMNFITAELRRRERLQGESTRAGAAAKEHE